MLVGKIDISFECTEIVVDQYDGTSVYYLTWTKTQLSGDHGLTVT